MLIDVFERPQRFHFHRVGHAIVTEQHWNFTGKFAEKVGSRRPWEFVASVTVEARSPTFLNVQSGERHITT